MGKNPVISYRGQTQNGMNMTTGTPMNPESPPKKTNLKKATRSAPKSAKLA